VGDILKIKAGMNIPVDGVVLKASGVQCNEAAMTGESDELKKDNMDTCKAR
jgi:P-type E1-E2 ATPase